jgi:hypothetical protein
MNHCAFTGYDYGVRSTDRGMVGSGYGNSFTNCFYGIYMDSDGMGVSQGNPHRTDFDHNTFTNNAFAVRLVSKPNSTTAYDYRVHDSVFEHNLREFWISPSGNYYFYRNYYGGKWKPNQNNVHWKEFLNCNTNKFMKENYNLDQYDEEEITGSRPGRYYDDTTNNGKANVITAASKANKGNGNGRSAGGEGYWIYDREDQNNWILMGENLPLAQESLEALTKDTPVTVVEKNDAGQEVEVAVITFRGSNNGGEDQ